jgi:hypothetical protein
MPSANEHALPVRVDRFLGWFTESRAKSGELREVNTFHQGLKITAKYIIAEGS